jgi:hypothetical protein
VPEGNDLEGAEDVDSVELMARIFDSPENFGLREKVA